MKPRRLKFRILSEDVKLIEIDSQLSAAVGTASQREMKGLVLTLIGANVFSKQTLKTIAWVLVRTYPYLWDYLTEVRGKLDDRGVE